MVGAGRGTRVERRKRHVVPQDRSMNSASSYRPIIGQYGLSARIGSDGYAALGMRSTRALKDSAWKVWGRTRRSSKDSRRPRRSEAGMLRTLTAKANNEPSKRISED